MTYTATLTPIQHTVPCKGATDSNVLAENTVKAQEVDCLS